MSPDDLAAPLPDTKLVREALAIAKVVEAIKAAGIDETVLAYQRQQLLPRIAEGDANKVWFVPTDVMSALSRLGVGGENAPAPTPASIPVLRESPRE